MSYVDPTCCLQNGFWGIRSHAVRMETLFAEASGASTNTQQHVKWPRPPSASRPEDQARPPRDGLCRAGLSILPQAQGNSLILPVPSQHTDFMFSSLQSHFQLSITSPFSSPRNFPSLTTAQRSAGGGHGPAGPRGACALRTGRGAPASSRSLSLTRKCPKVSDLVTSTRFRHVLAEWVTELFR